MTEMLTPNTLLNDLRLSFYFSQANYVLQAQLLGQVATSYRRRYGHDAISEPLIAEGGQRLAELQLPSTHHAPEYDTKDGTAYESAPAEFNRMWDVFEDSLRKPDSGPEEFVTDDIAVAMLKQDLIYVSGAKPRRTGSAVSIYRSYVLEERATKSVAFEGILCALRDRWNAPDTLRTVLGLKYDAVQGTDILFGNGALSIAVAYRRRYGEDFYPGNYDWRLSAETLLSGIAASRRRVVAETWGLL